MRLPVVAALVQVDADDALGAGLDRLGLHPLHGDLPRIIERLREIGEFDVLADRAHRFEHAAVGDVIDAAAHHHFQRTVAGQEQGPEILA